MGLQQLNQILLGSDPLKWSKYGNKTYVIGPVSLRLVETADTTEPGYSGLPAGIHLFIGHELLKSFGELSNPARSKYDEIDSTWNDQTSVRLDSLIAQAIIELQELLG